ncbi:MAG: zf-HC2 domain-containing protein [Candidatus Eisenbacteria bacterium]
MARTCRIERYLTAYADGELSPRLRGKVERHLETCETCARELDSLIASDRIRKGVAPSPVSDARWSVFRAELSRSLDRVDRETATREPTRHFAPPFGAERRRALAVAGAFAVVAFAVVVLGPAGRAFMRRGVSGNECMVDSIESYASGYTPMFFTSEDPEMTVIWVFSEDVEGSVGDDRLGAP